MLLNLPRLVLAIAGTFVLVALASSPALAQAQAEVDKALLDAAENYWHYAKVANYPLAVSEGMKVLQYKDKPVEVLRAFEQVSAAHKDNMDASLLRWQRVTDTRAVTGEIIAVISDGYKARRSDPANIRQNIDRLSAGERGYLLAVARLRDSGEQAIPMLVDVLRDPAKRDQHVVVRRALIDLGRTALNPLLASTEMKDSGVLTTVVGILGEIGYEATIPYLLRLSESNDTPAAVKAEVGAALARIGVGDPGSRKAADEYYNLAEKFYYDNASISADARSNEAFIWYWNEGTGLQRKIVPAVIFNEIMAMRACEYTLKLDPSKNDAISLWLASNYKREAQLPEGATDTTRLENQPPAHYYGVDAGTQYLNSALARALRDRDNAVALKAVKSLEEIAGQSNVIASGSGGPLIDAMAYPDRQVRFEAAFAVAAALPQQSFVGQERVVPLLGEAVSQTGAPNVLVVMPETNLNATVQQLKDLNYNAVGASSAEAAINSSAALATVDVILISGELSTADIDRLLATSGQLASLQGSAKLIVTLTPASPYATRAVSDPLVNITQAREGAPLAQALESARARSGALAMNPESATSYALRSAQLLRDLAVNGSQVLDLMVIQSTLLGALNDTRPPVVMAIGEVVGRLKSADAQIALLSKAVDSATSEEVKISLYKSLATNAKFHGNLLAGNHVEILQNAVNTEPNLEVRAAAAEACGALNLPPDQAKKLIIDQSRV